MRTAHAAVVINLADRPVGAVALPSKAIDDAGAAPVAVTITIFDWRLRRLRVTLPVDAAMASALRRWGRRRAAMLLLSILLGGTAVTGLLSLAVGVSWSAESLIGAVNVAIALAFLAVIWRCLTTQPALWPQVTATGQVLIRGVDPDVAREWAGRQPGRRDPPAAHTPIMRRAPSGSAGTSTDSVAIRSCRRSRAAR